jgi:hypothetical protein
MSLTYTPDTQATPPRGAGTLGPGDSLHDFEPARNELG